MTSQGALAIYLNLWTPRDSILPSYSMAVTESTETRSRIRTHMGGASTDLRNFSKSSLCDEKGD